MTALAKVIPLPTRGAITEEQERVVMAVLSRFIGTRKTAQQVHILNRLLRSYSDPIITAPPDTERGWASTETAMRKLGIDSDVVRNQWALANQDNSLLLPVATIDAIVPKIIWPTIWRFISDGPAASWDRCNRIFHSWCIGLELDASPRPRAINALSEDGKITDGTLGNYLALVKTFRRILDEMRRERVLATKVLGTGSAEACVLDAWTPTEFPAVPTVDTYEAPALRLRKFTPSSRLLRVALVVLNERITALRRTKAGRQNMFRPIRARAVLGAAAVLGGRRGAIRRLRRSDLVADYLFEDGARSPALLLRPAKTRPSSEVHVKAIPETLYRWIVDYADHVGIKDSDFLFVSSTAKGQMSPECYASVLRYALRPPKIPTSPAELALVEAAKHFEGAHWTPNSFRRFAEKLAYNIGEKWRAEHRVTADLDGQLEEIPPAQAFADCLLDHESKSIGDLYKGLRIPEVRAVWAKEAALGIGQVLFEDAGARKGPDLDRIAAARRTQVLLSRERGALLARLDKVSAQAQSQIRPEAIPPEELMRFVARQQAVSVEASVVGAQLAEIGDRIAAADAELESALAEQVPIPDTVTDDELEAMRAHASQMHGTVVDVPTDPDLPEIRNWATLEELHRAVGQGYVGLSTVRRWMTGHQRHPDGDSRNLFDMDAVEAISRRRRRLLLDRLDASRLSPEIKERLDAIRYLPVPENWRQVAANDPKHRNAAPGGSAFSQPDISE
jgi:hypothetical protein